MNKTGLINSIQYWYWFLSEGDSVFDLDSWEDLVDDIYRNANWYNLNSFWEKCGIKEEEYTSSLGMFIATVLVERRIKDLKKTRRNLSRKITKLSNIKKRKIG